MYTFVYIWGSYNAKWAASRDNPVTEGTTLRFCASHATNNFYGTSIRAHACSWPSLAAIAGPVVAMSGFEPKNALELINIPLLHLVLM